MKRTRRIGLVAALAIACTGAALADRTVQVTFTCHDPSGAPMADVPLSGRSFFAPWGCTTNAAGTAVVNIVLRDDERSIRYSLMPKEPGRDSVDDVGAVKAIELSESCFFRRNEVLTLTAGQSSYAVNIALVPARKVKFRCLDASGSPQDPTVYGPGITHEEGMAEAGHVVVYGVPADAPCVLMVNLMPDIYEIPLPAATGDVDLGDVTPLSAPHNATLSLELTNVEGIDGRGYDESGFVFLVSTDGQRLLLYVTAGYKTVADLNDPSPASMPAGEYWVSPFEWSDTGPSGALLKLVRAGVDLSQSGIPKFVVAPGGHAELQVDVAAAQQSILRTAAAAGLWPEY